MATRFPYGRVPPRAADPPHNGESGTAPGTTAGAGAQEDVVTGLPWTETLLPLIMQWAGTTQVHILCLHFVGLGLLASVPEFQSAPSMLQQAAERLNPLLGDDDRLSRFSGNKLMLFSKRSEPAVKTLLVAASESLGTLGTRIKDRHVPEIRIGMSEVDGEESFRVTVDTLNSLITRAAAETVPMGEIGTALRPPAPVTGSPQEAPPDQAVDDAGRTETPAASTHQVKIDMEAETMIVRGHPERTPLRSVDDGAAPRVPSSVLPSSEHRLILRGVDVQVTGMVATALIDLDFEGRKVRGKAIGRSAEQYHAGLVGEALTRAVTDLLPAGHGAVFRQTLPISTDYGNALVAVVEFLTPEANEFLFGVAPADGESLVGVAKSILSAVNHKTAVLLERHN